MSILVHLVRTLVLTFKSTMYLSSRSEHNSSNFARVRVVSMCLGPSAVAVINGRLQEVKE